MFIYKIHKPIHANNDGNLIYIRNNQVTSQAKPNSCVFNLAVHTELQAFYQITNPCIHKRRRDKSATNSKTFGKYTSILFCSPLYYDGTEQTQDSLLGFHVLMTHKF
jgi:hypothetical protein